MQFFFDMKTPFIDFMLPSELLEKRKDKFQSNFMNFVLWYFGFRVILTDVVIVHSDIFNLLLLLLLLLVVVVVVSSSSCRRHKIPAILLLLLLLLLPVLDLANKDFQYRTFRSFHPVIIRMLLSCALHRLLWVGYQILQVFYASD